MVPYIDMSNYDAGGCLHDLFTRQAAKTPNKIAVVTADGKQVKTAKFTFIFRESHTRPFFI